MRVSGVVLVAGLVPLLGLVFWLDRTLPRFLPPLAGSSEALLPADALIRRLAQDLDRAEARPGERARTYRGVVVDLAPTIRRRLASGDLPAPVRARLQAALDADRDTNPVATPAQLAQLLEDLKRR